LHDWQIEDVKKAVAEAESGDFATDEHVKRTVKKWIQSSG
jgi:predicted transcriptional regulator